MTLGLTFGKPEESDLSPDSRSICLMVQQAQRKQAPQRKPHRFIPQSPALGSHNPSAFCISYGHLFCFFQQVSLPCLDKYVCRSAVWIVVVTRLWRTTGYDTTSYPFPVPQNRIESIRRSPSGVSVGEKCYVVLEDPDMGLPVQHRLCAIAIGSQNTITQKTEAILHLGTILLVLIQDKLLPYCLIAC